MGELPSNTGTAEDKGLRRMQKCRLRVGTSHFFSNMVIVTVITGSLTSIVLFREMWPFSHYPMFSGVQGDPLVRTRLYGVTTKSAHEEVPLLRSYIAPLGEPEIVHAMRRLKKGEDGQRQLKVAVSDCLDRYEKRRVAGEHTGPPLQGIRLYRLTWDLEPTASNVDRPKEKELLMEVMIPLGAAE